MSLVDSHCHLDDAQFADDREKAIERAQSAGVHRMLTIGTGEGPPDLEAAIRLADAHDSIYATVGIHPQHALEATPEQYLKLEQLLRHPKCVAVGEIGLDYYWKPYDKDLQTAVFTQQMDIASSVRKPIIVHTRHAWTDTIRLLREHWTPTRLPCVMHCFTGGPAEAREALELGLYLSFAGIVTYPKAVDIQEAVKLVPLDRLLVETDAPYLAPVPHRGKRNEPAFVIHTARKVAGLRGEQPADLARAVYANFTALFSIE